MLDYDSFDLSFFIFDGDDHRIIIVRMDVEHILLWCFRIYDIREVLYTQDLTDVSFASKACLASLEKFSDYGVEGMTQCFTAFVPRCLLALLTLSFLNLFAHAGYIVPADWRSHHSHTS